MLKYGTSSTKWVIESAATSMILGKRKNPASYDNTAAMLVIGARERVLSPHRYHAMGSYGLLRRDFVYVQGHSFVARRLLFMIW